MQNKTTFIEAKNTRIWTQMYDYSHVFQIQICKNNEYLSRYMLVTLISSYHLVVAT